MATPFSVGGRSEAGSIVSGDTGHWPQEAILLLTNTHLFTAPPTCMFVYNPFRELSSLVYVLLGAESLPHQALHCGARAKTQIVGLALAASRASLSVMRAVSTVYASLALCRMRNGNKRPAANPMLTRPMRQYALQSVILSSGCMARQHAL